MYFPGIWADLGEVFGPILGFHLFECRTKEEGRDGWVWERSSSRVDKKFSSFVRNPKFFSGMSAEKTRKPPNTAELGFKKIEKCLICAKSLVEKVISA